MNTLLTIGHSNHALDDFLDMLDAHEVETVADVRSWPRSRFAPHFNARSLGESLREQAIQYLPMGESLGGRPKSPGLFTASGQADYQLMARTLAFQKGVAQLLELAREGTPAMLCSERDPHLCHRALLVAQQLHEAGNTVAHIVPGRPDPWPHREFLQDLARRWKVNDPNEALRLQAAQSAYRR